MLALLSNFANCVLFLFISLLGKTSIWCFCLKFLSVFSFFFLQPPHFHGDTSSTVNQSHVLVLLESNIFSFQTPHSNTSLSNQNMYKNKILIPWDALSARSVFIAYCCADTHRHLFVPNLRQRYKGIALFGNSQTASPYFPFSLIPSSPSILVILVLPLQILFGTRMGINKHIGE